MSNSSVSPQPDDLMKDDSNNNNNWILLDHCDLKGMNIIVDQSSGNVVTFSTRYCRDTERWRGEMPSLIQVNGTNFRTLQTLDLHNSRYLVALSSTLGLQVPLLRRLILTRCNRLERLPESICSLQYLEELNLTDSPNIEVLPSDIGNLKCLKRLILGGGSGYHNKVLTSLPESLGDMSNLEELVLDKCKSLKSIPSSIGQLSKLTRLSMKECKSIAELPESIGTCSQLVELSLLKCINLVELPITLGNLKNLEDLNLGKCLSLQSLPECLGDLQCLAFLSLRDCNRLCELPESTTRLSALFRLDCKDCTALKRIPTNLTESLSNLTELELSGCDSLLESAMMVDNHTKIDS